MCTLVPGIPNSQQLTGFLLLSEPLHNQGAVDADLRWRVGRDVEVRAVLIDRRFQQFG